MCAGKLWCMGVWVYGWNRLVSLCKIREKRVCTPGLKLATRKRPNSSLAVRTAVRFRSGMRRLQGGGAS